MSREYEGKSCEKLKPSYYVLKWRYIMLLFLIGFVASVNDSIGYSYLMEYDPGVVTYHNLSVYGNGSYYFEESHSESGRSSLNVNYYKRHYSLKSDWYLGINPRGSFSRRGEENSISAGFRGKGDCKFYPISAPIFLSSEGDLDLTGSWRDGEGSDYYITQGELRAGIGFGRMIPLSTAYQALKIEEELVELGKLDENISKEELKQVADFLSNSSRYLDAREFWQDFENIIKNLKGFNTDRLGTVSTIRIDEIINKGKGSYIYNMSRDRGYAVKGHAGYEFYGRSSTTGTDIDYKRYFLGGNFTYSRPLSTKLQFLFDSRVETYVSDSIEIKNLNISSSLYYEVLKKLYLTLTSGYYSYMSRYNERKREYLSISLEPTYYIQYRMALSLRGDVSYYIEDIFNGGTYRGSFGATINYYLF